MLIRIIALMSILQVLGCQRVSNAISTLRLDCGEDSSWDANYVKFVDGVGNSLSQNLLEYQSLEGQSSQSLKLSSKGCLALEKNGLWLVRHREKPEGLILDFSKLSESAVLRLQDISQENLKPDCPAYETGNKLDLRTIVKEQSQHDLRGYEISFSFRSDKIQKTWPRQNFSFLRPMDLPGIFPEGVVNIELTVTNNFQGGEQVSKSCPVNFDYTGPTIEASLHQGRPETYKGRPFTTISSDVDLRFASSSDDFSSFEVCFHKRLDWDTGESLEEFTPLCESPERIPKDRPVPFDSRKGFWQVQYRGLDPAGNASRWSEPMILLFEQQIDRQKIVNKAMKQSAELAALSYRATPSAMLTSLEIYQDWMNLPTAFEREQLEDSILLTLHRPWMEPTIQVNLKTSSLNSMPEVAFPLLGGKKFITIEGVTGPDGEWRFDAKLTDVTTLKEIKLPIPKGRPNGWQVSKDGQRFFWFSTSYICYGRLVGDEVLFQTLDYSDSYVRYVRFLNDDTQLVVLNGETEITYFSPDDTLTLIDKLSYPIDVHLTNKVPSQAPISDDTKSVIVSDDENNTLTYWSLFEPDVRKTLDFNPELIPGFYISQDGIRVLDTDRHFYISYTYSNPNYCTTYYYDADLPDHQKVKMLLEATACDPEGKGTILGSEVWMNGATNMAAVIYKPGSAAFRKPLLDPELLPTLVEGYSLNRYVTENGKWMFSGSRQDNGELQNHGITRVWKRSEKGDFEFAREFWTCGAYSEPDGFQFDELNQVLYHICRGYDRVLNNYDGVFLAWNMAVDPPQLIYTTRMENKVATTQLVKDQLLIGASYGVVYVFDLHGTEPPTFRSEIKFGNQTVVELIYDKKRNRIYSTESFGEKPIKQWDLNNFSKPSKEIAAGLKQIERSVISSEGRYLAVSASANTSIMIWDTQESSTIYFTEHSTSIKDIAFIGGTKILASGAANGVIKLWDFKNPDMPSVSFSPGLAKQIKNIASVPGSNEFSVETDKSRMFHYRLDSLDGIVHRTCETLRIYLLQVRDSYPVQAKLCESLAAGQKP